MSIPTEPIGSIPRPFELVEGIMLHQYNSLDLEELNELYERALTKTIRKLEETGAPVISDGEQLKPSFATYPLHGLTNLAPDGAVIPFADGHIRRLPRLVEGPFRYAIYSGEYVKKAKRLTKAPIKQAVISASAGSLIYPKAGIVGYSQEKFMEDLVSECVKDIRSAFNEGAYCVQMDFTEARLSLKLDPSGGLLNEFININNRVFSHFNESDLKRMGVHVCPGADSDSTHSADVDYIELLPQLFNLKAYNFYLEMAAEPEQERVLQIVQRYSKPHQRIFVGVIDVNNPMVETPEEVCERVMMAAKYIPLDRLGTCDDCGYAPFCDDISTVRVTAFEKIKSRVLGTQLASMKLALKMVGIEQR